MEEVHTIRGRAKMMVSEHKEARTRSIIFASGLFPILLYGAFVARPLAGRSPCMSSYHKYMGTDPVGCPVQIWMVNATILIGLCALFGICRNGLNICRSIPEW